MHLPAPGHHIYKHNEPFITENGSTIQGLEIAYSVYGQPDSSGSNIVWVCHALTANSRVADWWPNVVGEGKLFDPQKHLIICANMLGSCYGTTGPLSTDPHTGKPYYKRFPAITTRDMAAVNDLLCSHLGIDRVSMLIGGSMGGHQAMEWAIMRPDLFERMVLLATSALHSPWAIALNETQRMAIEADYTWLSNQPDAGRAGLKAARAVALLSYRNYQIYLSAQSESETDKIDNFRASGYQRYQGEKLAARFNAHSYYWLTKAMDAHNVGRERGGIEIALANIATPTLVVAIKSDVLFPVAELRMLAKYIPNSRFVEFESNYGHDGFLVEGEKITVAIREFIRSTETESLETL